MKIFDDSEEENNSDETKRKYTQPTREEFEEFLDNTQGTWDVAELGVGEYVYECDDILPGDDVVLQVFSTISKGKEKARERGEDSIKTVIWSKRNSCPVGGRTKTLRIKTWRKNLREKINDIADKVSTDVDEYSGGICDNCGSWMIKRDGKYGEFWGCSNYPDCQNTEKIDDNDW